MNIFNSEMYPDPTAYHALTKIQKEEKASRYRPLVYICSPYSGDIAGNTEKAIKYCRFAVDNNAIPLAPHLLFPQFMDEEIKYCRFAVDNNAIPLAPHLLFPQFMDEERERDLAIFMDMVLIGRCEQLWVFGETITEGMQAEINKANKKGIKIRHFTDLYKEYK